MAHKVPSDPSSNFWLPGYESFKKDVDENSLRGLKGSRGFHKSFRGSFVRHFRDVSEEFQSVNGTSVWFIHSLQRSF